ncbi:MAG: FixH family protein [Planctomycetaceae bacterium]
MTHGWLQLEFLRPEWLSAVAILPLLGWLYLRSLVDLPKRQMIASLCVRAFLVLLLILALAGLNGMTASRQVFVVFAVDRSLSIGESGRQSADRFLQEATGVADRDRFVVLPFASSPQDASADGGFDSAWQSGSHLQNAIEVARAAVPPDRVPHVVLLSDGNQTSGDVMSVLNRSARISTVPLETQSQPELQVSAINVPAQVADGEPFQIEVVVNANHDDQAMVEVFRDGYRILAEQQSIAAGENLFRFPQQIDRPTEFTARLTPVNEADESTFRDHFLDNNTASGLVYTAGQPRVLFIERVPELARPMQWALKEEGIQVDVRPPAAMPDSLAELQNYEVVMLSNVPANDLSTKQMDVLRSFVSDVGGGFIMLGGDESFGLGGYYKTVVEDILPVRSDFEKEKQKPGLGMVLVIDKSGSMGGQKIELAKDAARGTVELLSSKDQIGVIAFDGSPYWVSPITSAAQKSTVIDRIASIEAGGGTSLYPAMQEAFQALQGISAKLKHVIVLTDGFSTPGDLEGITQDMAALRITVSTVGLGDVDQGLLERMADIGGGRSYFCTDASSVPQIFARETITASKSAINEEPFLPTLVRATPVLEGVPLDDAPFLLGYVVTRPRPTSEVILAQPETGDPILSWWRYGLGMSVAFTSDARSRWAADWLTWDGYNRFWAQVVRHCMRKSDTRGLTVDVQRSGDQTHLIVDTLDGNGEFLNSAVTTLTLVDPDLKSHSVRMAQTAPGRYEAVVETKSPGTWNLQLTQSQNGEILHQQSRGLVIGYSDELRLRGTNRELLQSIARASGGTFEPAANSVFEANPTESAAAAVPLWPWLLSLAAMLFVADVALRRLDLSRLFGTQVHRSSLRA